METVIEKRRTAEPTTTWWSQPGWTANPASSRSSTYLGSAAEIAEKLAGAQPTDDGTYDRLDAAGVSALSVPLG